MTGYQYDGVYSCKCLPVPYSAGTPILVVMAVMVGWHCPRSWPTRVLPRSCVSDPAAGESRSLMDSAAGVVRSTLAWPDSPVADNQCEAGG